MPPAHTLHQPPDWTPAPRPARPARNFPDGSAPALARLPHARLADQPAPVRRSAPSPSDAARLTLSTAQTCPGPLPSTCPSMPVPGGRAPVRPRTAAGR